jgi:tetratricopeptide (TPR) repeat protein
MRQQIRKFWVAQTAKRAGVLAIRAFLPLTLVALVSGICAGPVQAQLAPDPIAMGIAATEARDLRAALRHFELALAQDPSSYEANWRAAMTLGLMGDPYPLNVRSRVRDSLYARAERYARRAVRANPAGAEGHVALAASLGRAAILVGPEEKVRRAGLIRDEALRALAINPRQDEAHHILGRWNAEVMRLPGISRFFAQHFLGASVFNQASWQRAIDHMEQAVRLTPGRIAHRLALADIYADAKDRRRAEEQLRVVDSLPLREAMDTNYKQQAGSLRERLVGRPAGGR